MSRVSLTDGLVISSRFGGKAGRLPVKTGPNEVILGVQSARLVIGAESGDADVFTQTTDFRGPGDWITEESDAARIKATNTSGTTQTVKSVSLYGQPVTMLINEEGYIHDSHADWDDVEKNGEKTFEFGNSYVVTKTQLEKLADLWWKYHKDAKHIYVLQMPGTQHFWQPGEWVRLQVGGAGEAEYIDSTCEIFNIRIQRRAGERGETVMILREIQEAWKFDSNAKARFVASGGTARIKSGTKMNITIASSTYTGPADDYCNGTNDEETINAWIARLAASGLNGTIHLTAGTFNLGASIEGDSNLVFKGEGQLTVLKKNGNFNAIKCVGSSGSEKSNIVISDMQITRDASDENNIALMLLEYCDDTKVERVYFNDAYVTSIQLENADGVDISYCTFYSDSVGVYALSSDDAKIIGCSFIECATAGIRIDNTYTCEHMTISSNGFRTTGKAIEINDSLYILIASNIINGGTEGIQIDYCRYGTITGNIISGCSSNAIDAYERVLHTSITGNTIYNSDYGIVLAYTDTNSDFNTIASNSVSGCTNDGISIHGDDNTIGNNISDGNGGTGIIITASSDDDNVVTGNRATGNTTAQYTDNGTNTTDVGNNWT